MDISSSKIPHNLAAALDLARAGLRVFPVRVVWDANKKEWLKTPMVKDWANVASDDPDKLYVWWGTWPHALPGIPLKDTGLALLDADRNHKPGVDGISNLEKVFKEAKQPFPKGAPMYETPQGGMHIYLRQPTDGPRIKNTASVIAPGVDTRGDEGFAMAPGGRRSDGKIYKHVGSAPELMDAFKAKSIPACPGWLAKLSIAKKAPAQPKGEPIDGGATEASPYGKEALARECARVAECEPGARNQTLNEASFSMGQLVASGDLPREMAEEALVDAADECGLDRDEALPTLSSGLLSGMSKTRDRRAVNDFDEVVATLDKDAPVDAWPDPQPIRSRIPRANALEPDLLPEAFRSFVYDTARRLQAPPDYIAIAAIVAAGVVVGSRVRIQPKDQDNTWTVVATLWAMLIGDPSTKKTPSVDAGISALQKLEHKIRDAWEARQMLVEADKELHQFRKRQNEKEARDLLEKGDEDAARQKLAAAKSTQQDGEPSPRLIVHDATVEKLVELLAENEFGLLNFRDELAGLLARLNREDMGHEKKLYLEMWNGARPYVQDRIQRGSVFAKSMSLWMLGSIQPSALLQNIRSTNDGTENDGFIARFQLSVWPDKMTGRKFINEKPDDIARIPFEDAFRRLRDLVENLPSQPLVLKFEPKAQALFANWCEGLLRETEDDNLPSALVAHVDKMPKTISSLALLFELIDGGTVSVGVAATERALAWADYLRSHAEKIYACATEEAEDAARTIRRRRDDLPDSFTVAELVRKGWGNLRTHEAAERAVAVLEQACIVQRVKSGVETGPGRWTTRFMFNPKLSGNPRQDNAKDVSNG